MELDDDESRRGRQLHQPEGPSSVRRQRDDSPDAVRRRNSCLRAHLGSGLEQPAPSPFIRPDVINRLDGVAEVYYHQGPYDSIATERNGTLSASSHGNNGDSIREHRLVFPILPNGSMSLGGRTNAEDTDMMAEDQGARSEDDGLLVGPFYNQEDIERRRVSRKRSRSAEREETEAASNERAINGLWKKGYL
ncbi:hypothetical protein MGYG_05128 [Nannizzia gypsea CBS 118893]|uniref:Uncharacterized protein n=1 Tax=Arthroderma gypseum (strain ATCC MYA-4604 / CBS 118893) TaxID=535722 RepID=E4UYG3_ARTGP|nr:hypothetical protein MGYG_05128 [Nannizzia gypsea CBS 118893]EFR02126.1 hypothetical protein MGYG_05128 [Nannizzia gypsea CBS 118893]